MTRTAYIAVNGNDDTAALDDERRPFKTPAAASAALKPFRETCLTRVVDLGYVKEQIETTH